MHRFFYILIFLVISNYSFSQKTGDLYKGFDCDYVSFVNDTILSYNLDFGYWGTLHTYNQGLCKYSLKDSLLTLFIVKNLIEKKEIAKDSDCRKITAIEPKDYEFQIVKLSDKGIYLIGPILKDYQKMNRKRFVSGFLDWPWNWSFKKQHWYDPRWRELKITGANTAYK